MTPVDVLRITILVCSIAGIAVWIRWWHVSCSMRWIAIAPLTWLVDLMAFYTVRQFSIVTDITVLNLWSSAVHLHALILLIAAGALLCRR